MTEAGGRKTAIVLFNLGGPDSLEAVEPFLFNLFNDKAIIGAPALIRWFLARRISRKRAPVARGIYAHIGGRSPLVPETQAQARALEHVLGHGFRCFLAMRYWHPFTAEAVTAIKEWGADEIVLLPLYPQFSTTTTGSSLKEWQRQAKSLGLNAPVRTICC
ncbi:MAG: ferrochelatase, partial [Magnetospirillum sp.]|nr:ferrochelatase [Magnetospirillum sp.]